MQTDCMCKDRCRHGKTCDVMGKKGIGLQTQTMSCSAFDEIINQTNEEWFCLLSTEQKAEALAKREAPQTNITEVKAVLKEKWLEWLKAVHKE